ncbi:MAG: hypothetical protein IJ523_04790 [Succinivibrionaceae bacterium]|nr:hypothetical protein [Succinivibrionaceae bacterium]
MRRVLDCIRVHLRDRLKENLENDDFYDNVNQFYNVSRSKRYCTIEYLLEEIKPKPRCKPLKLVLAFEISEYLYYGVGFSNDTDLCESIIADRIKNNSKFHKMDNWNDYTKKYNGNDGWLWKFYFFKEELNFVDCSGRYSVLFDPIRFEEIMQEILNEVDDNLDCILKTGLPKNLDRIEKYKF